MDVIYTKIDSRLWSDEEFTELSVNGKLLFIYVLTCNHRNMIGLYSIPVLYAQADLGWTNEQVCKGFNELLDKGFIKYNFKTNIIFIKNFLKYNPLENPNQVKGAMKAMETIPTSAINSELVEYLRTVNKPFLEPLIELLSKGLGKQEEKEEEEEEEEEEETITSTLNKTNIDLIIKEWNKLNLQNLVSINSNTNRHTMLKARIKEYSLDKVIETISSISKSPFLQGQNDRNWTITFDWLVRPNNFLKVLEGNYIDKEVSKNGEYSDKSKQSTRETEKYSKFSAEDAGVTSF